MRLPFSVDKPVIGVLHLPPLPGAPRCDGSLDALRQRVLADAEVYREGGVHGVIVENFGDAPFYPGRVPSYVATHMTALTLAVRERFAGPVGVNVLRSDGLTALDVAHAAGADFIRVNVLCGARATDQGLIEGTAHELLRRRRLLGAERIAIFADVDVKHSAPLAPRPLDEEVGDTLARGGADAVIVTGGGTGRPTSLEQLKQAKSAAGDAPVLVGSGATTESVAELMPWADGFLIGTSLKQDGQTTAAVDLQRVREMMRSWSANT